MLGEGDVMAPKEKLGPPKVKPKTSLKNHPGYKPKISLKSYFKGIQNKPKYKTWLDKVHKKH
jgi:hypothetical protein